MKIHFLALENMPIWEQLFLEEALLRADNENWCIINHGTSPSVVMGISGKPEQLLDSHFISKYQIPVWRRFSGGGTVFVDHNTLFSTFIFNSEEVGVKGIPSDIYAWTEEFYQNVFPEGSFVLKENDYVNNDKKFGGNAQYIRSGRWLHHTSFLWDYNKEMMNCLLVPQKAPSYREERPHTDFLWALKGIFIEKQLFFTSMENELRNKFSVIDTDYQSVCAILKKEHRRATVKIETF